MDRWSTWEEYGKALGRRVPLLKRAGLISLLAGVVCVVLTVGLWFLSVPFDPLVRCSIIVSGLGFGLAFVSLVGAWGWGRQVRWYTSADSQSSWRRTETTRHSQKNSASLIVGASLVCAVCLVGIVFMAPLLLDFTLSDDVTGDSFYFAITWLVLILASMCMGLMLAIIALMIVYVHDAVLLRKGSSDAPAQAATLEGTAPAPVPYASVGGPARKGPQTWEQYGQAQRKKASLMWKLGLTGALVGLAGGGSSVLQWVQGVEYQPAIHVTIVASGLVFTLGIIGFVFGLLMKWQVRWYDDEERRWQFEHSPLPSGKLITVFWVFTAVMSVLVVFSFVNELRFTYDYWEYDFAGRSVGPFLRFMWKKLAETTPIAFCLGCMGMVAMTNSDTASWRKTLQNTRPT